MSLSLLVIVFFLLAPALAAQVNTTVAAGTGGPVLFSGSGWTDGQVSADLPPCGWSTDTNGDSATFTFQGSALYVLGDKPSTDRFSDVVGTLDGQSVPLIPGDSPYCNEWIYAIEGLQEGLHTFVVTVQDNTLSNPPTFFSLISMTYTWTELDTTSSPGSTSSTTTESSTTVSSPTSESATLTSTSSSSSDTSTSTTSSIPSTSSVPETTETPTSTSSVPSTSSTSVAAPSVTFTFSSNGPGTPPTQTTSAVTSPTSTRAIPSTHPTTSPTRTSSSQAVTTPASVSSSPTEATSEQLSETSSSSTAPDPTVVVGVSSAIPSNTPSSSSSSSQQTSSVPVSPTIQPTPTPSSNNSSSAADHSSNSQNRTAVIAGSTVGAITAAGILLAASYAAAHPGWVENVLISISNALGIGAGYTVRRLIIKKSGGLKLPDTKIALFITTGKSDAFALDDSVIAWQINNINDQNDFFTIDIPCTKRLKTRLYFGTYVHADHSDRINVESFGEAPATLEEEHGHIRWDRALVASDRVAAQNRRQLPTSIVLGTGSTPVDKKEETAPSMIPFLRIPDGEFKPDDTYEVQGELYLRAFRVKSDCQVGQPGTAIANPLEVVADELTKPNSIAIDELAPLTTWNITGKKNGGLSLNITTTKKTDKKQYKHECVVDKKARREAQVGGDEEDLV